LLLGLLFSSIIPFIVFPESISYNYPRFYNLKVVEINGNGIGREAFQSSITQKAVYGYIYLIGVVLLMIRFIFQLRNIYKLRENARIVSKSYGKLIFTGIQHPIFTFQRSIYIDIDTEQSNEFEVFLKHEKVHIDQLHTFDLLLAELLAIVQWFNPFVWQYRKIIRQNHEFIADEIVLNQGFSIESYQRLILGKYASIQYGFISSFHSLTFKRIIMMKNSKKNKLSAFKLLLIVPILTLGLYLVSCSNKDEMNDDSQNTESKVIKGEENDKEGVLQPPPPPPLPPPPPKVSGQKLINPDVEVMAEFPGGESELINFLAKNTNYPKVAKEKGTQGKVFIQFMVDKTGKVLDAKVLQGVDPLLDKEALRVVNSMPVWKPGTTKGQPVNVHFTIPISFKLQ
jgi:TonB family protein